MLADPVTISADSPNPAMTFAVTRSDGFGSERLDTTNGIYRVVINHSKTKTNYRHYVQLLLDTVAVNPYTGQTQNFTSSVSLTINRAFIGNSDSDMVSLVKALIDFVNDSEVTPARLLQFQS
jgi:VCBS repeat-containing protein